MRMIALCAAGIVSVIIACSGCETTRGLGEDIQNTGTNLRQGVEKVDPKEQAVKQSNWTEPETGNQTSQGK